MLRERWTPVHSAGDRGFAGEIVGAGWAEVSNCSGTGLTFCTFNWRQGSRCTRVITYGEYLPRRHSPKVYDAATGRCTMPA
jgi:hypothetical protein